LDFFEIPPIQTSPNCLWFTYFRPQKTDQQPRLEPCVLKFHSAASRDGGSTAPFPERIGMMVQACKHRLGSPKSAASEWTVAFFFFFPSSVCQSTPPHRVCLDATLDQICLDWLLPEPCLEVIWLVSRTAASTRQLLLLPGNQNRSPGVACVCLGFN
jgi:hypothetical protein